MKRTKLLPLLLSALLLLSASGCRPAEAPSQSGGASSSVSSSTSSSGIPAPNDEILPHRSGRPLRPYRCRGCLSDGVLRPRNTFLLTAPSPSVPSW